MTTEPTTPAPAPEPTTVAGELVDELALERPELTRTQLYAVYGLLIAGVVAIVLLRATRKRAGGFGVAPAPAGAPSAAGNELGALDALLGDVPDTVRVILEHYARATEERLGVCADAVQECHRELVTIRMRLAELDAGKPLERGAAPLTAPRGAAHSARESDDLSTTDAGTLEPVPALADASAGTE